MIFSRFSLFLLSSSSPAKLDRSELRREWNFVIDAKTSFPINHEKRETDSTVPIFVQKKKRKKNETKQNTFCFLRLIGQQPLWQRPTRGPSKKSVRQSRNRVTTPLLRGQVDANERETAAAVFNYDSAFRNQRGFRRWHDSSRLDGLSHDKKKKIKRRWPGDNRVGCTIGRGGQLS